MAKSRHRVNGTGRDRECRDASNDRNNSPDVSALDDVGINIGLIASSGIKISFVVSERYGMNSLHTINAGFGLGDDHQHLA